jgi:Uma2 family endonuclease
MKVEEPVANYGQLDLDKEYSYFDYIKWTFSERVELIKGKILKVSPAPNRRHQGVVVSLCYNFENYFRNNECQWYPAPFDVRLHIPNGKKNHTAVQPDLCVICDTSKLDDAGCNGTPDLMLEILSPSNQKHDLVTKYELYEEAEVKEYWIVDPLNKTVLVYTLIKGKFQGLRPFSDEMIIASPLFPEMQLSCDEVLGEWISFLKR